MGAGRAIFRVRQDRWGRTYPALGYAVLRDVELVADRLPVRPCEVALEHGVGVLCMLLHVLDPKSLQNAIPGRTLHLHILYEPTRAGTRV